MHSIPFKEIPRINYSSIRYWTAWKIGIDSWVCTLMENTFSKDASSPKTGLHEKPLELISIIPQCAPWESRVAFICMCHETAYTIFFLTRFCSWSTLKCFQFAGRGCWMWNLPTGCSSETLFWGILQRSQGSFIRFTAGSKLDGR